MPTYMRLKREHGPWHVVNERYVNCGMRMATTACGLCVREIACEFVEQAEDVCVECFNAIFDGENDLSDLEPFECEEGRE
jgi:hypothetical protein